MLVIGYGNAGRGDDGLGPAFAARMAEANLPDCLIEIDYQLTVDHALLLADATTVVFVDALIGHDGPYRFKKVQADRTADLASHSLLPGAVLTLADMLYDAAPVAYVLGISGASFGSVAEGLSATAEHNLELAQAFFLDWLADAQRPRRASPDLAGHRHA